MVSDAGLNRIRPVFAHLGGTSAELAEVSSLVRELISGS
jgi:hypothetical protein